MQLGGIFANVLAMCHEACEESLAVSSGINLKVFLAIQLLLFPLSTPV